MVSQIKTLIWATLKLSIPCLCARITAKGTSAAVPRHIFMKHIIHLASFDVHSHHFKYFITGYYMYFPEILANCSDILNKLQRICVVADIPLPAMNEMVKGALSCFVQWPLTNIKRYWDSMFWFMSCEDIINACKHTHEQKHNVKKDK